MPFKVVFLRPSNKTGSAYMTKWGFLPAPLGLLALAGELLRIPGCTVDIIDQESFYLMLGTSSCFHCLLMQVNIAKIWLSLLVPVSIHMLEKFRCAVHPYVI